MLRKSLNSVIFGNFLYEKEQGAASLDCLTLLYPDQQNLQKLVHSFLPSYQAVFLTMFFRFTVLVRAQENIIVQESLSELAPTALEHSFSFHSCFFASSLGGPDAGTAEGTRTLTTFVRRF